MHVAISLQSLGRVEVVVGGVGGWGGVGGREEPLLCSFVRASFTLCARNLRK